MVSGKPGNHHIQKQNDADLKSPLIILENKATNVPCISENQMKCSLLKCSSSMRCNSNRAGNM